MKKLTSFLFKNKIAKNFRFPFLSKSYSTAKGQDYDECKKWICECDVEKCLCGPPKTFMGKDAPKWEKMALNASGEFEELSLSDFKGKWVCLFFYPLDFTFVCPTEIWAFSDRYEDFKELNCEIIGASVDSHFSHKAWTDLDRKKGGLGDINIPIVSDLTKTMSRDYGVLNEDGIDYRGLFLIDPNGILRQIIINDIPIGRSVDEVIRLIEALQFFDENGEVCPANWEKGGETIKGSVEGSKEFFEKVGEV